MSRTSRYAVAFFLVACLFCPERVDAQSGYRGSSSRGGATRSRSFGPTARPSATRRVAPNAGAARSFAPSGLQGSVVPGAGSSLPRQTFPGSSSTPGMGPAGYSGTGGRLPSPAFPSRPPVTSGITSSPRYAPGGGASFQPTTGIRSSGSAAAPEADLPSGATTGVDGQTTAVQDPGTATMGPSQPGIQRYRDGGFADLDIDRFVPGHADTRTWTDASGRFSTEARFLLFDKGTIYLRKSDGGLAMVPVQQLSQRDREYVLQLYASQSRPLTQDDEEDGMS